MHQRHVSPGKEGEEPWHCQHRADLRLLLLQPQPKGESIRKGFSLCNSFYCILEALPYSFGLLGFISTTGPIIWVTKLLKY